jgi:molybdenum cofactor synthesis domain-containing protein
VSDRCARGESEDLSGQVLLAGVRESGGTLVEQRIVADDRDAIQAAIRGWSGAGLELILTTGGTGLGPRDVTPEALDGLWTKRLPGFGEKLRESGALHTPRSWLSRSEAGLVGTTLVILLPGSPTAVGEGLDALAELIPHAVHVARGGNHGKRHGSGA